jgi:hypothetical protein
VAAGGGKVNERLVRLQGAFRATGSRETMAAADEAEKV